MSRLAGVVAGGDRAAILDALSGFLADVLEAADPPNVAQLAKQLRETVAERDSLKAPTKRSASDDLARRRADRRSTSAGAASPGGDRVDSGRGSS